MNNSKRKLNNLWLKRQNIQNQNKFSFIENLFCFFYTKLSFVERTKHLKRFMENTTYQLSTIVISSIQKLYLFSRVSIECHPFSNVFMESNKFQMLFSRLKKASHLFWIGLLSSIPPYHQPKIYPDYKIFFSFCPFSPFCQRCI